eukprot:scaffold17432_cov21-Tisochrysis_lutea.AAC.2
MSSEPPTKSARQASCLGEREPHTLSERQQLLCPVLLQARDAFYNCVREQGGLEWTAQHKVPSKCKAARAAFEKECLPSWMERRKSIVHFPVSWEDHACTCIMAENDTTLRRTQTTFLVKSTCAPASAPMLLKEELVFKPAGTRHPETPC